MILTTSDILGIVAWVLCLGFVVAFRRKAKLLAVSGTILIALGLISIAGNLPTIWLLPPGLLFLIVAFFARRSLDS